MFVRIFRYCILTLLVHYAMTDYLDKKETFEYGARIPGEQVSFAVQDNIPAFNPVYTIQNITPQNPDTEKRFTYLRVDYANAASRVKVEYDPKNATLTFYIQLPFMKTAFGVLGYSMPLNRRPVGL